MFENMQPVPEFTDVTSEIFRNEIYPASRPVIMRGLTADWESVQAARKSDQSLVDHLKSLDNGNMIGLQHGDPGFDGKLFYNSNMTGVNFHRKSSLLGAALDQMLDETGGPLYIPSTPVDQIMPKFLESNGLKFLSADVLPRLWIGNSVTVQTHFDLSQNIVCVVAGRRRITLFPPEQTPNLYMGPLDHTPSGVPVSLVDMDDVDHERFPNFREAVNHAMVAELGPGDALFIPYFWWHHVHSLEPFNFMVNYWWNEYEVLGSPMDALLHSILSLRDLPPAMKAPWKVMFDQFIFADDLSASDHIPPAARGGLGAMNWQSRTHQWQTLSRNIANLAGLMSRNKR